MSGSHAGRVMATKLLDRLKRSLFKDGQGVDPEQEPQGGHREEGFSEDHWEAELEEEEECVTDRLGGTLCFDSGDVGPDDGAEGEGSGLDSDSDFLGESMEEGPTSTDASPVGISPVGPAHPSFLAAHLQEGWSWRSLRGFGSRSAVSSVIRQTDTLLFEVTDASVIHDGASKYVLYTIHVIQSGGSDKTPAIITRRYSDFQRLHATLRRKYGDQMERICFPRKKLRRNFAAETIAVRSRAFEQYLSHLYSVPALREALCVRQFFYLSDLQAGQLLIRSACFQEALGPLLNAKRLQYKLGWTSYQDNQAPLASSSSHWFFTLVGLLCCFQEVGQLEEARDHCDHALQVLIPTSTNAEDKPLPPHQSSNILHPLLLPLLRVVVRLSWQTGKEKRQWEELLQYLEERQAGLDSQPTIQEFLVKHSLQKSEGDG